MAGDGKTMEQTKPQTGRGGEVISMKIARRIDPDWRKTQQSFRTSDSLAIEPMRRPRAPVAEDVNKAIENRDLDLVMELHCMGAPLDEPDSNGWTPFANAIAKGRSDIAGYILSHGVDHTRRVDDQSYLMLAAAGNRLRIGKRLLESHAYSERDSEEAFRVADENGHAEFSLMIRRHLQGG
ncbi:ankyrin repeat domain-containing protein [Candidatus Micrarchaeota archaeon]|nr:ankyrin repeat domain-containing protein [Candidatus Micrarchaeota archaeon]